MALEPTQYVTDSLEWSGGSWSEVPLVLPGGGADASGDGLQMNGVSCYSTSICMAVGTLTPQAGGPQTEAGVAEEWQSSTSTWSQVLLPTLTPNVELTSVSCPSASVCYAVGSEEDKAKAFLLEWQGTSFSVVGGRTFSGVIFNSVSCSGPSTCVAVGGGSGPSYTAVVLNGSTPTTYSAPDPTDQNDLTGVSCPTANFCVAVGSASVPDLGWAVTLTEIWDGSAWHVVPSPNLPAGLLGPGNAGGGILLGVSCASPDACVAVGSGGGGPSPSGSYPALAIVATWNGWSWSSTPTPAPIEPRGAGDGAQPEGVSCVPDLANTFCMTVGYQAPSNGDDSPLVMETTNAIASLEPTWTSVATSGEHTVTATVSASNTNAGAEEVDGARPSIASLPSLAGTVSILDDGLPIPGCPPVRVDDLDQVGCTISHPSGGHYTADYSGNADFAGSGFGAGPRPPTSTTSTTTTTAVPARTGSAGSGSGSSSSPAPAPAPSTTTTSQPATQPSVPPPTIASCSDAVKAQPGLRFRWVCLLAAKRGTSIILSSRQGGRRIVLGHARVAAGGVVAFDLEAPARSERVWFSTTVTRTSSVAVKTKTGATHEKTVERRVTVRLATSRIEV